MKNRALFACFLVLLPLVCPCPGDEFMDVDEIKPGMTGTGRTVFKGKGIEEFKVEIMGVLKNIEAKGDVILARLEGGPLEKTGVIAGMSGSPVYIDGRLIGAVAFSWGFSKEPIAGITPIRQMMRTIEKEKAPGETGAGTRETLKMGAAPESAAMLRPISTPVMISGVDRRLIPEIEKVMNRFGFIPAASGGASGITVADEELQPGSVVGVQLAGGDIDISAVGTMTYRSGNNILAFGHPFVLEGDVEFPLVSGYVHGVLPSQAISFKLSSSVDVIGKLKQDRMWAISGTIGESAPTVPLNVHVNSGAFKKEYSFTLARDDFWIPMVSTWCVSSAILATEHALGDSTVRVKWLIDTDKTKPVEIRNVFASSMAPTMCVMELGEVLQVLAENPFEELDIRSIDANIDFSGKREITLIESAASEKAKVEPAEEVRIRVYLKPFDGEREVKELSVKIPEDTPDGEVLIHICDGMSARNLDMMRSPGRFQPSSLEQLVRIIQELENSSSIVVKVWLPTGGAIVRGVEYPSLPSSVKTMLASSRKTGMSVFSDEIKAVIPAGGVVAGHQVLRIMVERKPK